MIEHAPADVPISPGNFQVVIGAASGTKYSITVRAHIVEASKTVVRRQYGEAMALQESLPAVKFALDDLWNSMRLAERKILVVQGLMDEAEAESKRCETEIENINEELAEDDEKMELVDEERHKLFNEVRQLEVEFAYFCRLYATRAQERRDIRTGLVKIQQVRRAKLEEKDKLEADLSRFKDFVPAALAVTESVESATNAALELNSTLQLTNAGSRWKKLAAVKSMLTSIMTPAEEVRKRHHAEGWETLVLEEQQWSVMDRTLNAEKYDWLAKLAGPRG